VAAAPAKRFFGQSPRARRDVHNLGREHPLRHRPAGGLVKAVQIVELSGPQSALSLVELPEPQASDGRDGREGVVIDVRAAGVSFPELLQTRGQYQVKPPLPFVPGSEVAGVVRSAPADAEVKAGERVAAFCALGGFAEATVALPFLTFKLADALDFAQGAGLILNYHTVYFALALRGRLQRGESVLVHGAAGGIGSAALQVAKGLGARTIAAVSSDVKRAVAEQAGADAVVRSDGDWREQVKQISGGGVDVVLDPVGGDRFTDSLRCLRENGRLLVVGFAGGSIPEVRVNRLLLRNLDVVGAGWGAYVMDKPDVCRQIGAAVNDLVDAGFVRPIVGERFALQDASDALLAIEQRRATGKVVLELPPG
jgi:NADPH:quinone reductase